MNLIFWHAWATTITSHYLGGLGAQMSASLPLWLHMGCFHDPWLKTSSRSACDLINLFNIVHYNLNQGTKTLALLRLGTLRINKVLKIIIEKRDWLYIAHNILIHFNNELCSFGLKNVNWCTCTCAFIPSIPHWTLGSILLVCHTFSPTPHKSHCTSMEKVHIIYLWLWILNLV